MNPNSKFKYLGLGLSSDIKRYKNYGDFKSAIALINRRLKLNNQPQAFQDNLLVQREIINRLPNEYKYKKEEAIERAKQYIPDFTEEEFDGLVRDRKIEWIYIQGKKYYFNRFLESVLKTNKNLLLRYKGKLIDGETVINKDIEKDLLEKVMYNMKANKKMAIKISIRASVEIKNEYFKAGELVKVHLPIPRDCSQQSEIEIKMVRPSGASIGFEDSEQRTIYWEEEMTSNHPFIVEYSYLSTAKYNNLESIIEDEIQPDFDTNEKPPHIVFTPYIRELARSLVGEEKSQIGKAKLIYNFITQNVNYSYMRSYFCLDNIPEYGARNLRGDCGVMTLLFITLCRCVGIPARWESGLIAQADFCGAHDWAKFYVSPYGWINVDPAFGEEGAREGDEEKREFYFGNIDPFRMVANSEFQSQFAIPKKFWRADPYDNQVGEIETSKRGLQYFEFDNFKEVIDISDVSK